MNELSELSFIETPLMDRIGFLQLLLRFLFNLLVVSVILRCFYYMSIQRLATMSIPLPSFVS